MHGQTQDVGKKAAPPSCILSCACRECYAGYIGEPGTSTNFKTLSDCHLHHPASMASYKLTNQKEKVRSYLNLKCCTELMQLSLRPRLIPCQLTRD